MLEGARGALELVDASATLPGLRRRPGLRSWHVLDHDDQFFAQAEAKKRKRDAADESVGEFDLLGVDLSMVVMDLSRRKGAQRVRDEARAHKDAADQASLARDEKRKEVMLENQIKCYCKAQDALDVAPLVDDATLGGRASLAQLTARVDAALASKATPGAHTLLKVGHDFAIFALARDPSCVSVRVASQTKC